MAKKKITTYTWSLFFRRLRENIFRPKRQMKDIVFRLVFGNDRQALLQLYNALHGTAYTDPDELQIVTLDNAIYILITRIPVELLPMYDPCRVL